tara:strand:+ start:66 stop:314 length:249 start_codon:yes stop_codon:yes gene_type:complete
MESFGWLNEWYMTIAAIVGGVVIATRLREQVHELRKDVDDIQSRNTFVVLTKVKATQEMHEKQIGGLWEFLNRIRDRMDDRR